jgi:hypothetical protein
MATFAGMCKRRQALPVGEVHVGTTRDQHARDLDIARAAVAQYRDLEQGRPAEAVDMVDVDRRLQELAYRLDMAMMAGRDQGRAAIAIGAAQIGASRKRQLQDLAAAVRRLKTVRAA